MPSKSKGVGFARERHMSAIESRLLISEKKTYAGVSGLGYIKHGLPFTFSNTILAASLFSVLGERSAVRTFLKACASLRRVAISWASATVRTRSQKSNLVRTVFALLLCFVELASRIFILAEQLPVLSEKISMSASVPERLLRDTVCRLLFGDDGLTVSSNFLPTRCSVSVEKVSNGSYRLGRSLVLVLARNQSIPYVPVQWCLPLIKPPVARFCAYLQDGLHLAKIAGSSRFNKGNVRSHAHLVHVSSRICMDYNKNMSGPAGY